MCVIRQDVNMTYSNELQKKITLGGVFHPWFQAYCLTSGHHTLLKHAMPFIDSF